MNQSKLTKLIEKEIAIDEKFPIEQAVVEKVSVETEPSVEKGEKVSEKNLDEGFSKANQDGHEGDKKFMYHPVLSFNGKIKVRDPKHEHVRVEYEIINEEKRRMMSGHRKVLSLEEFYTLPGSEKTKLQGGKQPFVLYPGMNSAGNIPYADTNAVSGKRRKPISSAIFANTKVS